MRMSGEKNESEVGLILYQDMKIFVLGYYLVKYIGLMLWHSLSVMFLAADH